MQGLKLMHKVSFLAVEVEKLCQSNLVMKSMVSLMKQR